MAPEVLFFDNHLIVTIKPHGIPTQSTPLEKGWQDICKEWGIKEFNKPGKMFLEPIHRLDKAAWGIVVFARTSKALSRLQEMMRQKKFQKTYKAVVEGPLLAREGVLEDFLMHDDHRAKVVPENFPGAKKAILHYKVSQEKQGLSEVDITLVTGRYHQIRAQFSSRGFPIAGDARYGAIKVLDRNQIALWHVKISFEHPVTHEGLCFSAKPLNPFL